MTTEEIAKLYIEHAGAFRELLGKTMGVSLTDSDGQSYMELAYLDRCRILYSPDGGWRICRSHAGTDSRPIPAALAVAAMAGAWPERLKQEHGLAFKAELIEDADRGTPHAIVYTFYRPQGASLQVVGHGWTIAGAICAAVNALVAEKRAKEAEPPSKATTGSPTGGGAGVLVDVQHDICEYAKAHGGILPTLWLIASSRLTALRAELESHEPDFGRGVGWIDGQGNVRVVGVPIEAEPTGAFETLEAGLPERWTASIKRWPATYEAKAVRSSTVVVACIGDTPAAAVAACLAKVREAEPKPDNLQPKPDKLDAQT